MALAPAVLWRPPRPSPEVLPGEYKGDPSSGTYLGDGLLREGSIKPRRGRQGCDSYYRWSTGYSWTPKSAGVYEVRERYSWRKSRYHLLNQVRQIIGSDGRVSRSYPVGGTTYETFEWDVDDRDYGIASIEFANGLTTSFRYMT